MERLPILPDCAYGENLPKFPRYYFEGDLQEYEKQGVVYLDATLKKEDPQKSAQEYKEQSVIFLGTPFRKSDPLTKRVLFSNSCLVIL